MRILVVEDEDPKARHIRQFLFELVPEAQVEVARSVRAGLDALSEALPDLLILDMSLPTFDIGPTEAGGRPQGFGGLELIRNMELEGIECPTIVLTGYEAFAKSGGQVTLDGLSAELREEHPTIFRGIFHFNSAYGDWQAKLRSVFVSLGVLDS